VFKTLLLPLVWTINDPDPAVRASVGWGGYLVPLEQIGNEDDRAEWDIRHDRLADVLHRLRVFCEVAPDTWSALLAADETNWFKGRANDRVFVERLYLDARKLGLMRRSEKPFFVPGLKFVPVLTQMRCRFRGQRHPVDQHDFLPLFSISTKPL
jgi:hypothetical protein